MSENPVAVSRDELADAAQAHYKALSDNAMHWSSVVPEAIEAWRKLPALEAELAQARTNVETLLAELEGFRAWKRSVDEALNSGDGAYRP